MEKQILHVDVNNAFLSWSAVEKLKNGESLDIRTIPSIIGGDEKTRRGIVLAKSDMAKKVGIKTGEPIFFARKKCPNLKVYPCDFYVYKKYSDALYNLLLEYTDKIERFSIDECFMDMTGFIPKGKDLIQIGYEINKRVKEELGFTVNVGVAHNKLLAKMASDFEKPNKVHTLFEDEIENKMWTLPVSELFMVGRKSLPKFQKMGIKTIKDLANTDEKLLVKSFGKYGKMIWEYANGIDNSEVVYIKENPKGIGNSLTLPYDYSDIEKIEEVLVALAEQVTYRLRRHDMKAEVVNVQIKTNEFKVYSHQRKMLEPTDNTKVIIEESKKLLKELYDGTPIRLIGLRVDKLSDNNQRQLSLFDNNTKKDDNLDKVIDELKVKYGYNKITRAGKMNIEKDLRLKD